MRLRFAVLFGLTFGCASDDASPPGASDDTAPPEADGPWFPEGAPWTVDISAETPDPNSNAVMAWLDAQGWGLGRFQIDFSFEYMEATADTPKRAFEPTGDFYTPDCDLVDIPVPADGVLEGESGYACESDGDCHLIVKQDRTLYEMWRADIRGDSFRGGCLAVWDLDRVYGPEGRGLQCTSADAAGYPIAPLLFDADEIASGELTHAIRFILPNSSIRERVFVAPATHSTGATSGPDTAPPYGARLRLRAAYPLESLPNEAARTLARGLQRYGMFLADGGNVALTARADHYTTAKWDGLLGSRDLEDIRPADFELMPLGEVMPLTYDCVREP